MRSPVTELLSKFNELTEEQQKVFLDIVAPEPETEAPVKKPRKKRSPSTRAQSLSTAITTARTAKAESDAKEEEASGPKCGVCGNEEDYQDHHRPSPNYHPFVAVAQPAGKRSSRKAAAASSTPSVEADPESVLVADQSGD